jgi:hypothetical protein
LRQKRGLNSGQSNNDIDISWWNLSFPSGLEIEGGLLSVIQWLVTIAPTIKTHRKSLLDQARESGILSFF